MSAVPVAVLASGTGSNASALIEASAGDFPARVAVVVSDKPDAPVLQRARDLGVEAVAVPRRDHKSRDEHEAAIVALLQERGVQWVCLAGYMRLLGETLLAAYPWRILNIHPSLLPAFPGLHAQERAHNAGVRIAGCTLHFVDGGTDTGPIIAQGAVPCWPSDTAEALRLRILRMEHRLYPMVLRWAAEDRVALRGREVLLDLPPFAQPFLWDGAP